MSKALKIVAALLESEEDDDFKQLALDTATDLKSGEVNPVTAQTADRFYHRTLTYKDKRTPIEVRRNGKTKTWKTRPGEFQIPVKYGMYEYFYITQRNADEWSTIPLPLKEKRAL